MTTKNKREEAVLGCLLGAAVGDALGLPYEGLSRRRQRRLYPEIRGHRFLFGRGMTSDDTEHTCLVAQALIVSGGNVQAFARSLAWRLRFWLLGLPAGIGRASLRALVKLWMGFPSNRSGVFSAGNAPAMRSAVLGVCWGHDPQNLRALVRAATRITHTDPKAEFGALAVALAAHLASTGNEQDFTARGYCEKLESLLGREGQDMVELVRRAARSVELGETPEAFAVALGLERGVTGYVYHTVPVALQACLRYSGDYRSAILAVIRCGGDTDTLAAITGGIVGARVGAKGIPAEWLQGLSEWPRSVAWMERVGKRVAEVSSGGRPQRAIGVPPLSLFLRNLFFLLVVLIHGLRRLFPPY